MLYAPRIPTPPPISDIRKVKKENMPAKPKISKDQLFPEKVERAKQIVENSNIKEMVNGPQHYGGADNPYEVIKVCEAWGLDKDAYLFNVVKYVARAGKKDPQKELEDLKKAVFYLERKVKNLQK